MSTRTLDCDVAVIGAGGCGLFLANALLAHPGMRVVLVEAGPARFEDAEPPLPVETPLREHLGMRDARVIALGGATNLWGGGLLRMEEADLGALDQVPGTAWPIDFPTLCRGYELAEHLLDLPGFALAPGAIRNAIAGTSFHRRDALVLPHLKKGFSNYFGKRLRGDPRCRLIVDAGLAPSFLVTGGKLAACEYTFRNGERIRIEARHFVIAAGFLGSIALARELLAAAGAAGASPELGRNLHDHLSLRAFEIHPQSRWDFSRQLSYGMRRGHLLAAHYEPARESRQVQGNPAAFFHFGFDFDRSPLLGAIRDWLAGIQRGRPGWPRMRPLASAPGALSRIAAMRMLHRRLFIPGDVPILGTVDIEQVPDPRWKITFPANGPPGAVRMDWDISPRDLDNMALHLRSSRELLTSLRRNAAFAVVELFPNPVRDRPAFESWARRTALDTFHTGGGLRMGRDASSSMVTPDLALHAVPNVHILASSAMPRAGGANPTHTLFALGALLAARLAG